MKIFNWFKKRNNKACIDFNAGFNLTDLPIVTFNQGDVKLNFLLDTGSNKSLINSKIINNISHIPLKSDSKMFGVEGNYTKVQVSVISIYYNGIEYANDFLVSDLSKPFANIKKESGVTIHGILGNNFFVRNKSILNFEEMKAYFKK